MHDINDLFENHLYCYAEEAAYQVQGPYQVPQPLADVLLSNSTVEKQFWTLLDNICKAVKEF